MKEYAGMLGYYGYSRSESYNRNVDDANKIIDEYNNNVYSFETCDEQMEYQEKMVKESREMLKK